MRLTQSDIEARVIASNIILTNLGADVRIEYQKSMGWHVISEVSTATKNPYADYRRFSGTLHEAYDHIAGLYRGLCIAQITANGESALRN